MRSVIVAGLLAALAMTAGADEKDLPADITDWAGCQADKCNFECLVEGRWMHLGNTGKAADQPIGYRISRTDPGLLQVYLANQGDPVHYLISREQAFCRLQPGP